MPCYHDRARCHRPSYFNPHGGPITRKFHRIETWLSCTPLLPKLFLVLDFLCNSQGHFPSNLFWYQTQYLSRCSRALSHVAWDIERLPIHLKLLMVPSYFALDIFLSFNLRDTYASSHELTFRCSILLEPVLIEFFPSYPFISSVKILKEGRQFHHDALMDRKGDINAMDRPLREEQPRPRRFVRIP